jgi:hypothetical protein
MENKGLLFIPDISGFTRFVNETEIDHSRIIIQELLEILINANKIGLEISEIEGDAILFYRSGNSPRVEDIYRQVEQMFCDFHRHIVAYEHRRFCQCEACKSAINLTLKVITHYGEFTDYQVRNFRKLIGKDIIVAHQLLKNDIAQHEYWLVTQNLLPGNPPESLPQWMEWNSSTKQTESGDVPFKYTQLSQLKKEIKPESLPDINLPSKAKVYSTSREYEVGIITLFHGAGNYGYRNRWQEGVKTVEELHHILPRLGVKCRFVLEKGEHIVYASSYSFHPEKIQFSETNETERSVTCFTLEKIAKRRTKLTIDYYINKGLFSQLLFNFQKKKKKLASFNKSLENLDPLIKSLNIPSQAMYD